MFVTRAVEAVYLSQGAIEAVCLSQGPLRRYVCHKGR